MQFAATDWEFEHRFWIIGAIIFGAFGCYEIDKTNIAATITAKILGPGVPFDPDRFGHVQLTIIAIGAVLVALGALLRSWAESYLHSSIVHDAVIHSDQLVAEGPYRHLRNPLYFGNDLLALGLGLMASRLGFFVMVAGMFLFHISPDPARRSRPARNARRKLPPLFQRGPTPVALIAPARPRKRRETRLARRFHRRNFLLEHRSGHGRLRCHATPLDLLAGDGRRLRHLFPPILAPQTPGNSWRSFIEARWGVRVWTSAAKNDHFRRRSSR